MPQIFSRTADTWFRAVALGALAIAVSFFLVAFALARSRYWDVVLVWAYMHAMHVVAWAGDIPAEACCYVERGCDGRGALASLPYGLQGLATFAALLSRRVRSSPPAMLALASLTMLMRLVENAWPIVPGKPRIGLAIAPLITAAPLAMLEFGWFGATALRRPEGSWSESERVAKPRSV